MTLRHRKKRNAGLVYEFLVRRMAATMVDQDPGSYLAALKITKKYFSDGEPLAQERALFEAIVQNRGLSEAAAQRVLGEVRRHARSTDARLLEVKKSNLIRDVNYTFGQDFFGTHRVREYRLLATIQMLIDRYRSEGAQLNEDVERIRLEEGLIKYMTTREPTPLEGQGPQVDAFTASIAMKKFEERYSGILGESQRQTLRRYMNYTMTGDRERFEKEMSETRSDILDDLHLAADRREFSEDPVMKERLAEAAQKLRDLPDVTSESAVQDILLYQRLLTEIESDAD